MKGRLIALDHVNGREAAALMVDGRLQDLLIDGDGLRLGTLILAKVERPMKGQGGLIVSWPGGEGFLRKAKGLAPGQTLLVQVTGHAEVDKAPPVTDRVLFKGRYGIVTPAAPGLNISRAIKGEEERARLRFLAEDILEGSDHGLILRSAAEGAAEDEIADDLEALLATAAEALSATELGVVRDGDGPHFLAWRDWVDPAQVDTAEGSFDAHGITDDIEALQDPFVAMGQHSMWIEPTRALVAVDVNTGGDLSPAAPLKANRAAIAELPRQLRLRGLGGQVTIDFAPILKRDRKQLEAALKAAFKADAVETEVIDWTPLGHMELKRKRERRPLSETLA